MITAAQARAQSAQAQTTRRQDIITRIEKAIREAIIEGRTFVYIDFNLYDAALMEDVALAWRREGFTVEAPTTPPGALTSLLGLTISW